ncbi:sensor histidine kinase [Leptothoe sp. PORK10 BA2]|uniref:sensor histidine kinase n=1 Tax=Leptothoe sp. PORK10 BA2 TaxID=3110254 RepID=UPI002B2013D9|nr:HAMP domain-containing sensor histidine kinase [Leptothoe sp. PORK10 BA2]MEA5464893.1 HAMP domain-containing sensor histidine kinase [Leptothoe sp. PORK10 BA2]
MACSKPSGIFLMYQPLIHEKQLNQQRKSLYGLILAIFGLIILLEWFSSTALVFSYLYTGAIVLAHRQLSRRQVMAVTFAAVILTLINLVFPRQEFNALTTVANRVIAVVALLVTGYLIDRSHVYEAEIARQQAHIQTQAQLAIMREDFAATLTHDLKTPLLGAIETIKSFSAEQFGPVSTAQSKVLGMMSRSHQMTLQLVETMLDIYRNDAEGLGLKLDLVDLHPLLTDTVAALAPLAQSRQIKITLTTHGKGFWVHGDQLQLRRVFENLLTNAINHAPRHTQVLPELRTIEEHHLLQVQDSGPGIHADEVANLFDRFYQGYSDRNAHGSGLGLYLCRQIIEAHNGRIWAQNCQPHGAIFYFCLPSATAYEHRQPLKNSAR